MPTLSSTHPTLIILAGIMFALSFFIVTRIRLRPMLALFSWQSVLLALFIGASAQQTGEVQLLIIGTATLLLKAWLVPQLLRQVSLRSRASQRLLTIIRPEITMLLSVGVVAIGFLLARSITIESVPSYPIVGIAISTVSLGLLMLITHKNMFGQIIGFLLMENGIFVLGLTLVGGLPLLIELGIFFDIAVGAILMAGISYQVQQTHQTILTNSLEELVD